MCGLCLQGTQAVATLVGFLDKSALVAVVKRIHELLSQEVVSIAGDDESGDVAAARRDFGRGAVAETRLSWAIQALAGAGRNARYVRRPCVMGLRRRVTADVRARVACRDVHRLYDVIVRDSKDGPRLSEEDEALRLQAVSTADILLAVADAVQSNTEAALAVVAKVLPDGTPTPRVVTLGKQVRACLRACRCVASAA
jgi:hypothetical protein